MYHLPVGKLTVQIINEILGYKMSCEDYIPFASTRNQSFTSCSVGFKRVLMVSMETLFKSGVNANYLTIPYKQKI